MNFHELKMHCERIKDKNTDNTQKQVRGHLNVHSAMDSMATLAILIDRVPW